jgi:hypothetical protein
VTASEKDVRSGAVRSRVLGVYPAARIVKVNGRVLAVEDPGPESGFPVMVHNGAGSRHLFLAAVAEGQQRAFRLIGYDRPAAGRPRCSAASSPTALPTCGDHDRSGHHQGSGVGFVGRRTYALATAAMLPCAVTAVCLSASIGPYGMPGLDFAQGLGGNDVREQVRKMFEEPERARAEFRAPVGDYSGSAWFGAVVAREVVRLGGARCCA